MGKAAILGAAAVCLSFGAITAAQGAATATPTQGMYEAPLGGGNVLTFNYSTYLYPHVAFMTIQEHRSGSIVHNYFPGEAGVHNGGFHFFGFYNRQNLEVSGDWIASDVVKGTVKLPNGSTQNYEAKLKTGGSGGFGLPPAQHGVQPSAGHYKAPFGAGKHIEFTYHSSHVLNFQAGARHYFASVPVHGGSFTWTSHGAPVIRVVGHWTSAHEVVGSIGNHSAGAWEFRAHLQ